MASEHFLKEKEVLVLLGNMVKLQTLRNWRSLGFGPPYHKFGKNVAYSEVEVREWIRSQKVVPSGGTK